jgi:hypothetical protein
MTKEQSHRSKNVVKMLKGMKVLSLVFLHGLSQEIKKEE